LVERAREDPAGFSGRLLAPVELLMIGLDDLGVLDALLGFEGGLEDLQQVVGEADGDGLDLLGRVALPPGLALVELLLLLVEGLLDVPAQPVNLARAPRGAVSFRWSG
jgi:hypothetical protein